MRGTIFLDVNLKVSLGRLLKMNISQFHIESIWSKGQDKAPPFVTNTHERWAGAGQGAGAGREGTDLSIILLPKEETLLGRTF